MNNKLNIFLGATLFAFGFASLAFTSDQVTASVYIDDDYSLLLPHVEVLFERDIEIEDELLDQINSGQGLPASLGLADIHLNRPGFSGELQV